MKYFIKYETGSLKIVSGRFKKMKINLFLLGTVFGSTRENTKDSGYEDFNSWWEQWGYRLDDE